MIKKVTTIDNKKEFGNVCETKTVTQYYFLGIRVLISIKIKHFIEPSPSPILVKHRDWKEPIPVRIAH